LIVLNTHIFKKKAKERKRKEKNHFKVIFQIIRFLFNDLELLWKNRFEMIEQILKKILFQLIVSKLLQIHQWNQYIRLKSERRNLQILVERLKWPICFVLFRFILFPEKKRKEKNKNKKPLIEVYKMSF